MYMTGRQWRQQNVSSSFEMKVERQLQMNPWNRILFWKAYIHLKLLEWEW